MTVQALQTYNFCQQACKNSTFHGMTADVPHSETIALSVFQRFHNLRHLRLDTAELLHLRCCADCTMLSLAHVEVHGADLSAVQQFSLHELFPNISSMVVTVDCNDLAKDNIDNFAQALLQHVPKLTLQVQGGKYRWLGNGYKQLVSTASVTWTVTKSSPLETLHISSDVEMTLIMEKLIKVHRGTLVFMKMM